jgi:hypothetical protein
LSQVGCDKRLKDVKVRLKDAEVRLGLLSWVAGLQVAVPLAVL